MDLVLKGRGARLTAQFRSAVEHKTSKLSRLEPRLTWLEVEVVSEKNPRQGGAHRVEAAAGTPRKTFRAHADARDVQAALDLVVERLERQVRDHHTRLRARRMGPSGRVKSARVGEAEREERSPE
ncbi:MAG TPA: ribosome-associated translation inhibitor RaiA [Actinomycetota bacterium]|jgi:ribosomal subunit interface protein